MEKSMEIFTRNLKTILEVRGMQQQQLADIIGCNHTTISRYMAGIRTPRYELVAKMCDALHCSPSDLMSESLTKEDILAGDALEEVMELLVKLNSSGLTKVISYINDLREENFK